MKNLLQTIRATFLLILLLGSTLTVNAYDFEAGGIYYNITSSTNMTAAVTYYSKTNNTYSGTVTIPEKVTFDGKTYYVTAIGDYAFIGCTEIKKVTYGSQRITSIGNYAFQGCNGMTSFVVPTHITSIGNGVFNGCMGLTSVTIEESETTLSLGYNSDPNDLGLFYDCPLNSVFIGRQLSYRASSDYGYSPFAKNLNLVKARLGKKLASIPNYLFYGCTYLDEVTVCASTPPSANANCFTNYEARLYVPKNSVNAYRNADVWKNFSYITGVDVGDDDEPIVPGWVVGDVDGNGKVNIDDVTALIQLLLTGHL